MYTCTELPVHSSVHVYGVYVLEYAGACVLAVMWSVACFYAGLFFLDPYGHSYLLVQLLILE